MFYNASSANPDTSNWDVSSVTNMSFMFYFATSANPDTSNWDVSSVTNMGYMFYGATSANPDTSNWDVSSVTNMGYMFYGATSANPDTSNWDVSSVTTMANMFYFATVANPDTTNWDVSNVTNMDRMFEDSNLSVENLTSIYENWSQLSLQNNVSFGAGTTKYNASGQSGRDVMVNTYNWTITDGGLESMPFIIEVDTSLSGRSEANQFEFTGAEGDYDVVAKQNNTVVAIFNDLSNQQTITLPSSGVYVLEVSAKVVNGFSRIRFAGSGDILKMLDIKQWGDVVWSSFSIAFYGCENMLVTATDVPNLSSVTTMRSMFRNASSANPDTSNWDVSNVTDMSNMFRRATSANPDTSNWNVSSVTNMDSTFDSASSANPDTSNWDVSNVTDMDYMFNNTTLANPDTSNWNVSSVISMTRMFNNTTLANPDTSNWNVSNLNRTDRMFLGATSSNPDVSNWNVSNITNMVQMFSGSALSVENLTACYENWSQLNLQQNVSFGAGSTKYNNSGQSGRNIMVVQYNWSITDGGQV